MKLVCPNNCDAGRHANVGFRLVGVPITVMDDLTIDIGQVFSAAMNIHNRLIPGAKILCGGCHQQAIIEE